MIRFFVSSTFVDMAAERDAINQQVLPAVRSYLYHNHGIADVSTVDLRWGISTEELESDSGMKKILSVCMEEIDSCTPHMIILLGERYGSVPSQETIDAFLQDAEAGAFSREELAGKSVTEMEIIRYLANLRGLGADRLMIPVFICMRDPLPCEQMALEDRARYQSMAPEDIEKMARLRQYMLDRFPEYVLRYSARWDQENRRVSGLESFSGELTDRMIAALKKELPPDLATEEELQLALDGSFEENMLLTAAPRSEYTDAIRTDIRDGLRTIVVQGVSGSGKSCIASQLADILRKQDGAQVISMHCGNGRYLKNCMDILRHLVWRLERLTGTEERYFDGQHTYEEWRETARRLLIEASKEQKTVVIIDALNMLQGDEHTKTLDLVPDPGAGNWCFVLTASDGFSFPTAVIDDEKTSVVQVGTLTDDEITSIIRQQLAGRHKQLPEYAVRAVQEAAIYRTPLYLSFLIQRIDMLDAGEYARAAQGTDANGSNEEALYRYIREIIINIPNQEEDLAWHLFEVAASKLHFSEYKTFLAITAILQYGFRPQDHAACGKGKKHVLNLLDITRFTRYMSSMFSVDPEGRVTFAHQVIEQGVKKHTKGAQGTLLEDLLCYMDRLDDADPVKYTELFSLFLHPESPNARLDPSVLVRYISGAYLSSERDAIHSGKERDANDRQDTFEKIINSIRTIYIQDPQKQDAVFGLLSSLLVHASDLSVQILYGFISAILFSFDTLFGSEVDRTLIDGLMRHMHSLCVSHLYPYTKEDPLYLRCVYVCCEQCGNRAVTYEEKEAYYREFYQYANELGLYYDLPEIALTQWKHDMAVCYGHIAEIFAQRDYERALSYYGKAEEFLEFYLRDVSSDRKKRSFAERCIQDNHVDRANCVIQRARLNQSIGFNPGDGFQSLLDRSYIDVAEAIRFYESNEHIRGRDLTLARYWAILADYYGVRDDPEKQKYCVEKQMAHAKAEYERSRQLLALDQWRNSLLCVALSDRYGYSLEERTAFISQSFALAEQLYKSFARANPQMVRKILSMTLQSLVDLYEKRMTAMRYDDSPAGMKRDETDHLCLYVLRTVRGHMDVLFEGYQEDATYDKLMKLLRLASGIKKRYRNEAIEILRSSDYKRYQDAAAMAETAFGIGEILIPYQGTTAAFEGQVDTAYLCTVAFHNLHSNSYYEFLRKNHLPEPVTGAWRKESFFEEMMLVYDKNLQTSGGYQSRESQEAAKRVEREDGLPSAASWIRFLDHCCQNDKLDTFWKLCEKCQYWIPGQKLDWLYLTHEKYCFDDEIVKMMPRLGRYLIDHLDNPNVLRLLAKSDLFEATALEEAYKAGRHDAALTILDNQYDHYLELPLLFILRKYDRREFFRRFADLKPICVHKRKKEVRDHLEILTPFFYEEFKKTARKMKQGTL